MRKKTKRQLADELVKTVISIVKIENTWDEQDGPITEQQWSKFDRFLARRHKLEQELYKRSVA